MKRFLILIIFTSLAVLAYSQRFNGGAMIGMATSQVAGDGYSGFNKIGPVAGVFVNYQPVHHSSLQMELQYIQKGSRKSANYDEGDTESYILRLNYIEMPLLYQFHFDWFLIEAGPSLGFFMGGFEEKNGIDVKADDFAAVTFQLNFGVVFTVADNWKFGIRTNNAMTNLRKDTHTGHVRRIFPSNYGQFNDVILFTFAYQFMHWGN